jgi:hypothetical protein
MLVQTALHQPRVLLTEEAEVAAVQQVLQRFSLAALAGRELLLSPTPTQHKKVLEAQYLLTHLDQQFTGSILFQPLAPTQLNL